MNQKSFFDFFDHVYVLNLDRRISRWKTFLNSLPSDWPFRPPIRFSAVDGSILSQPKAWNSGPGAWGCYESHLAMLQHAIQNGFECILILEDDATCCEEFSQHVQQFLSALPRDWELAYLGGQHIQLELGLPEQVNSFVYKPFNVNRTHAYAVRGVDTMKRIHAFVSDKNNWRDDHHIDHFLGEYQKQASGVYAPHRWLVGQDEGESDVSSSEVAFRHFVGAEDLVYPRVDMPFCAVVGPYSSGTSAVAGALHRAGIPMGSQFEVPDQVNESGNFEATQLAKFCRSSFEEPFLIERKSREMRTRLLRIWAANHSAMFRSTHRLLGGKHPLLCLMVPEIVEAWNNPFIISVEREERDIVNSLVKRQWGWSTDAIMNLTNQLILNRAASFASIPGIPVLKVAFDRFVAQPKSELERIFEFLDLKVDEDCLNHAVASVRGSRRTAIDPQTSTRMI